MIKIGIDISYPGLTPAEEERLLEHIRAALQPHVARTCCSFLRDATGPDWDNAEPLRSMNLCLDGTIQIVPGEAADDRIRVLPHG